MLNFANSQALKTKQTKVTTAANIIKDVILPDLNELYSPAEIEILQQAQQLMDDGKHRIRQLKDKRRREEKQREDVESDLHHRAYQQAFKALERMSLSELYRLNVSLGSQCSSIEELIEEYDHRHHLATVQSWLDTEVDAERYLALTPEEARETWRVGIARAAVEIISWPNLKYHRDYQARGGRFTEPLGIPDDFPQAIYAESREASRYKLSLGCCQVLRALKRYEANLEQVRLILAGLGA
ncbi:hypothetical protein [Photobacterium atrarenae]|uniref:Uncharacterized protein n=1 Tax=Photobacterium atrarenae TaxID=865757 RepID=A0ABY5GL46_9GAMM|nr:hypothetical protein [Photobacterium atrarenae]UTV29501.1 hypothetical protein NNL38_21010 [Photobacterium atrarenae]